MNTEPEPFTLPQDTKVTYHKYTCAACGAEATNTYSEPDRSRMLERRLCWDCNYWVVVDDYLSRIHGKATIIDGHIYTPGNGTTGSMLGMGGRRFDIEYIEPSIYAGQIITTFDLWFSAGLPDKLREKYPDTARFINGAEAAMGCWNASSKERPPYKLPYQLVANKPA